MVTHCTATLRGRETARGVPLMLELHNISLHCFWSFCFLVDPLATSLESLLYGWVTHELHNWYVDPFTCNRNGAILVTTGPSKLSIELKPI